MLQALKVGTSISQICKSLRDISGCELVMRTWIFLCGFAWLYAINVHRKLDNGVWLFLIFMESMEENFFFHTSLANYLCSILAYSNTKPHIHTHTHTLYFKSLWPTHDHFGISWPHKFVRLRSLTSWACMVGMVIPIPTI